MGYVFCTFIHAVIHTTIELTMIDSMDDLEAMMEAALAEADRASNEMEAALKAGKEIVQVLCDPDTQRGDIIKVTKDMEAEDEDAEMQKAKVVACQTMTGMNPETFEVRRVSYAWCIILKDSDITTEEEFADLYAGEVAKMQTPEQRDAVDALFSATTEELAAAAVAGAAEEEPEPEYDPVVCECGANREMCERNQNMLGVHVNES